MTKPKATTATSGTHHTPTREELCRRIDQELAALDQLATNSWLWRAPETVVPEDERPLASATDVEATIGGFLWLERDEIKGKACLHVFGAGKLLAIVSPRTARVAVRMAVAQADLGTLVGEKRPESASGAPPGFREVPAVRLLWRFALHGPAGASVLPARYLSQPITLRRLPAIEADMMPTRMIALLQLINRAPLRFDDLLGVSGLSREQLVRDLTALFLARSISTQEATTGTAA